MESNIHFGKALIESQLFIADNGANLRNALGKLNYKNFISISQPLEMLFLCREIKNSESRILIMEMLDKLVGACIIDKAKTQIFELKHETDYSLNMNLSNSAKRIFFFDIKPNELHLHIQIKKYEIGNWAESKIFYCDGLEFLLSNKKNRGLLWSLLKQEFNIP
ncbi:MAG: hypothetical protein IPG60_08475 [Bacteroidetes bacterium]|nr:hypothetical protein [Bacteroidota bacterium]MBP7400175.1 hypothetical protein [Chitinophagales bacterium]MBK7110775.1 hypothetical protein [Bacteroidota bacterium]MBK8488005.1 hypothetical protein [Bacteroidota bacterium]MBK8682237.1 hypothetical protein [Bacteroidota bacterium]